MAVGIVEERHPEIVIVHPRDEMRRMIEGETATRQFPDGQGDIGAAEIDRAAMRDRPGLSHLLEQKPRAY